MNHNITPRKYSVGQALAHLRNNFCRDSLELYAAVNVSSATYLKIERDERDLSFLIALQVCQFYDMDIYDFTAMIDDVELERKNLSVIKVLIKRERKKAEIEALKSKIIDIHL